MRIKKEKIKSLYIKTRRNLKKAWRKFKYLDKLQFNYFIITSFIGAFCLFTGVTYSAFTISKKLNAAVITIAKLNYTLAENGTSTGYNNGSVSVGAGETVTLNLRLTSSNASETRYALNYIEQQGIQVYYSHNNKNNMTGTVSAGGTIDLRVIIVNSSESAKTVAFNLNGGYINNMLTTNIADGFYEEDITLRTYTVDANFKNTTLYSTTGFPSSDNYIYYKTECSEDANPIWDSENWTLDVNKMSEKIACDVYFKASTTDVEVAYNLIDENGSEKISTTPPANDGTYGFVNATCSNGGTATWNSSSWSLDTSGVSGKDLCIANFKKGYTPPKAARCIDSNGDDMTCPQTLEIGQRIAIGDEVFRFIRYTSTSGNLNECGGETGDSTACADATNGDIRAIAEYNLYVGHIYNSSGTKTGDIATSDAKYGRQDSTARGLVSGADRIGTTEFSSASVKGTKYSSYTGSIVEDYVEEYVQYLSDEYDATVSGGLITKAELESLGCDGTNNYTCSSSTYPWVYTTSYWSGSPFFTNDVWGVNSNADFDNNYYLNGYNYGVRPVITISASDI